MKQLALLVFCGLLAVIYIIIAQPVVCHFSVGNKITISEVSCGEMAETITLNGKIQDDSSVIAYGDELYFPDVSVGLHATSEFNGHESKLSVIGVDRKLTHGRFCIRLSFDEGEQRNIRPDGSVRMRVYKESFNATRLPVGGFYKDTGGKWVLLFVNDSQVVRRDITLGRKSPDYFEVIAGLQAGEKVITSAIDYDDNKMDFTEPVMIKHLQKQLSFF